ncbi:MAG: cation transporter [Oscillospiraceae bacterium]
MKQYHVTGMSCAACSARVEKAVSGVPGVTACSVSLLTNSMGVEGTAADQAIIDAVQAAGYGASVKGAQQSANPAAGADALTDHETPKLRRRLFWSLGFLLVLMYFSMGHMMWGWPLPKFYDGNHVAMGLTQLLLTVIIMVINQSFHQRLQGALHWRSAEHGHARGARGDGGFVRSFCALCHDGRAGARRAGRHELHDGLLL